MVFAMIIITMSIFGITIGLAGYEIQLQKIYAFVGDQPSGCASFQHWDFSSGSCVTNDD